MQFSKLKFYGNAQKVIKHLYLKPIHKENSKLEELCQEYLQVYCCCL
jgi:hypothetical protein